MKTRLPRSVTRRSALRGLLGGAAVSVGLPIFDAALNSRGTAFAAGAPLPTRFGTWFWGLGHTPGRGIEALPGREYRFIAECAALEPFRSRFINYFSGFNTLLDGAPSRVHYTGWVAARCGTVPVTFTGIPAPTLDTHVAAQIGRSTRFKSLELSSTGNPKDSYSYGAAGSHNAAEISPLKLYQRLFGPEFRDPARTKFEPDPRVLLRQSVLSAVTEERRDLERSLGAADRARLDQYFTSVRELEKQLDLVANAPPPTAACRKPEAPPDGPITLAIDEVQSTHDALARILVLALACDQTRVFNVLYSQAASEIRAPGTTFTHHILSHEEPMDVNLGYKVQTAWFNEQSFNALARFLRMLEQIKEGDGTLLDHMLLLAQTDTSDSKTHSVIGIPTLSIGRGSGRVRTGLHIEGNGGPISRIGLTAMQVMGVPIAEWGTRSLRTSSPVNEILT
jgi:hypothetical protein